MEKNITLYEHTFLSLNSEYQELIRLAKIASENAYAPYSNFKVGASVLLENGLTFSANNQENICFPVGICAERILLGYTHANYPTVKPLMLAIAAKKADNTGYATVTPCGLCRQSISEYERKFAHPLEIIMYGPEDKVYIAKGIDQLLPYKFESLNK
ncbi:cytidine deaminase [Negadavirga shengliensis]|uniref:Cytidine deaminase n=1 Tax=Negadavirga shengliensis TaxID=1389218 RepID=A0ABV9T6H1_9BACT